MWKRLNNTKGARQPAVADPGFHEIIDERGYAGSTFNRTQSPSDRNRPPPRPPREDEMQSGHPTLSLEPSPPPPPQHRDSSFRPASSIYSQPSPNQVNSRFPHSSYGNPTTYTEEEVSPPSSPDVRAVKRSLHPDDDEVSPIDDMPDISKLGFGRPSSRPGSSSKQPSSNIPILRREKRRNQVAAAASNFVSRKEVGDGVKGRMTVDPRWDPYSGEITTSDKGKPQSVKPGQFYPPGLRQVHKPSGAVLGYEANVSGPPKANTSFGERVRKLKTQNAPAERPEWKGATGRVTLVSPVADQPDIQPLRIPRKSSKRIASPPISGSSTHVSVIRSNVSETDPAPAQQSDRVDPTIRTVLSNSGRNSPRVFTSPTSITPPSTVSPPLGNNNSQLRTDFPVEVRTHKKQDSAGTIERNFREALKDSFPTTDSEPYVQPPSRFSVTTYAPSEAQSTPRPSTDHDRPTVPTPPQQFTTNQQPSPIVNRKRPKVAESSKATTRKAVNTGSPVFISMTSSVASKRASNIAKTLPQSPAEAESHDLITSLQAQLDNLAHRRNNITRSIRQMTELMPTDNIVITAEVRRKRDEEKRKVEGLREEEADIRREEHEIGLRLHRAYKRKDKDAVYEPTGLWVRRVTG